jgi:hypothetical protein
VRARERACRGSGVVRGTRVDHPVGGGRGHRHGAEGSSEGGVAPTASRRGPSRRGVGSRGQERGRRLRHDGHTIRRRRGHAVVRCSQERRRRGTGGTRCLARPHGDGLGPGVVEGRPRVAATPAGGTTTTGSATPMAALAGATASVGRGRRMRGHRDGGWRAGRSPGRRRTGGLAPRRRLTAGGSAVESRGRSGRLIRHGELLEEKLVPHGMEGGERHAPLDESLRVAVAGAEATQEVQHQGTTGDRLAEVAKRVTQALHLVAVFSHEEVPLREQVELGVEVERSCIPIPEELVLESEPRLARSIRLVADDVLCHTRFWKANRMRTMYVPGSVIHVHSSYIIWTSSHSAQIVLKGK